MYENIVTSKFVAIVPFLHLVRIMKSIKTKWRPMRDVHKCNFYPCDMIVPVVHNMFSWVEWLWKILQHFFHGRRIFLHIFRYFCRSTKTVVIELILFSTGDIFSPWHRKQGIPHNQNFKYFNWVYFWESLWKVVIYSRLTHTEVLKKHKTLNFGFALSIVLVVEFQCKIVKKNLVVFFCLRFDTYFE